MNTNVKCNEQDDMSSEHVMQVPPVNNVYHANEPTAVFSKLNGCEYNPFMSADVCSYLSSVNCDTNCYMNNDANINTVNDHVIPTARLDIHRPDVDVEHDISIVVSSDSSDSSDSEHNSMSNLDDSFTSIIYIVVS